MFKTRDVCNTGFYTNSDNLIDLIQNMIRSKIHCVESDDFDKFEFDESDELYEFFENSFNLNHLDIWDLY